MKTELERAWASLMDQTGGMYLVALFLLIAWRFHAGKLCKSIEPAISVGNASAHILDKC